MERINQHPNDFLRLMNEPPDAEGQAMMEMGCVCTIRKPLLFLTARDFPFPVVVSEACDTSNAIQAMFRGVPV